MSTQHIKIPRDADYLNEPVRWSDCLDFLGRLENELQRREDFWRNSPSDPHGIASAVMVAMAETSKATRTVTDEVVARKFNDEALRRAGEDRRSPRRRKGRSGMKTKKLELGMLFVAFALLVPMWIWDEYTCHFGLVGTGLMIAALILQQIRNK